jgi:hypothetical protein
MLLLLAVVEVDDGRVLSVVEDGRMITCEAVLVPVRVSGTEAVAAVEVVGPAPRVSIVTVGKEKPLQLFSNAKNMVESTFAKNRGLCKDALEMRVVAAEITSAEFGAAATAQFTQT